MTKKKKTKQNDRTVPPNPHLKKTQRFAIYTELLHRDPTLGYRRIHNQTGIPIGTIKSDFHRMNGSLQKALQQQQPPQPTATPPPTTPTTTPLHPFGGALATPRANGGMDWPGDLDKVATIVKASFAQTLQGGVRCECGRTVKVVKDPAMALRLASTFARMYTAKMGGDRVSLFLALNQPPPPVKDVEIRDVIAALRRHDTGLDCLLCGQPKPASQVVIDVPLQEEGGES